MSTTTTALAVHTDGGPATGLGLFSGTFAYTQPASGTTTGTIAITIQNTTLPANAGYIVAMAWNVPAGSTVTGAAITFNNTGMDVIGGSGFSGGIDCLNATTGFGNADIGLSIGTDFNQAGGTNGFLNNVRAGIRNFQIGTIVINLTGTVLGSLTASSWAAAKTSGSTSVFFPVHFRYLKNNTQVAAGDDVVGAS